MATGGTPKMEDVIQEQVTAAVTAAYISQFFQVRLVEEVKQLFELEV